jgi:hypothetical protein
MSAIELFYQNKPSRESYWRAIILFGRNTATYKFALGRALLDIIPSQQDSISLEDLAIPYSKYLCEHLKKTPRQATGSFGKFPNACKAYNEGRLGFEQLIEATEKNGFNDVLDAFHVVNNETIPVLFFEKDFSKQKKRIILRDDAFLLMDTKHFSNFTGETEARWNLVESAWSMGISSKLLEVGYDADSSSFFISRKDHRRKSVASARDALNGYQKSKCFFCFDDIATMGLPEDVCDVDHFFPHVLTQYIPGRNYDGVWNLVLACSKCNRGVAGKFAKIPHIKYLARLHRRNEYLICSRHPLRETLIKQTGATEKERIDFFNQTDKEAIEILLHRWETPLVGEETF